MLSRVVLSACVFMSMLCGCTSSSRTGRAALEAMRVTSLMYMKPEPVKSIHLEVDAVGGAQPTEDELQELVQFLERYTAKPVVLANSGQTISASEAKGLAPGSLATLNMDGPPEDTEQPPVAYIYVLLMNELPKWGTGGYAHDLYPHVIISMSYLGTSRRAFLREVLKHECGHLLGLCHNKSHGDGNHCDDQKCLMQSKLGGKIIAGRIRSAIGMDPLNGGPFHLCENCQQELRDMTDSQEQPKTEFRGRFLIRNEKDYFVATLPSHLHLGLGLKKIPWQAVLDLAMKQAGELSPQIGIYSTTYSTSYSSDKEKWRKLPLALEAALKDSDSRVVSLARKLKNELEKQSKSTNQLATSPQP